ncbi:ABC transporter permease [Pectobacterium aroidearum]|uniref:ABC transporter permease n=1 Tax=Pectobacterium aroidearum TaxID=1201031 RepID=UPI002A82CC95|nr:iron ABC transporter permease [Pectobacterium aroidearum]MDY4388217.1 iron ABC transporter permease [Pectobacterium aroidearum]
MTPPSGSVINNSDLIQYSFDSMISGVWRVSSWLLAGLLLLPLATVFYQAFFADGMGFAQLWQIGLPTYLIHSVVIVIGTLLFSLLFGLPSAWFIAMYRFPGHRVLQWALCLPIAMPAFLLAYLYTDALRHLSPLLREGGLQIVSSWEEFHVAGLPASLGCVSLVLALVLYPYIYLLVREALVKQPASLIYSARLLNQTRSQVLRRLCLPIALPAIACGGALVVVETLGDYGAASYLNIPTMTTQVLDIWQKQGDLGAAARLGVLILPAIFLLMFLVNLWRRKQKIYQAQANASQVAPPVLSGWRSKVVRGYCWGIVCLSFLFPVLYLLFLALRHMMSVWDMAFLHAIMNSLLASATATVIITLMALSFIFYTRMAGIFANQTPVRLVSLSFALPGAVLAVGLFTLLSLVDHGINLFAHAAGLPTADALLAGSLFILILAYSVKFGRLMLDSLERSMDAIPRSLDSASLVLGASPLSRWSRVHIPLLRRGLFIGALLIFTESMKELNVSLLLRPFGIDTLATYVFRFTASEQVASFAFPALVLVLVGLIPVFWLNRALNIKG